MKYTTKKLALHHNHLPIPSDPQAIRIHECTAVVKLTGPSLAVVILAIAPQVFAAAEIFIVAPFSVVALL
jgi:hypothetical protein